MKSVLSLLVLSVFLNCLGVVHGQVVDQLIDPVSLEFSGGNVIVVFDDLRSNTDNTHFEVQHSDNVTAWTGIPNSSVVEDAGMADRYTLTAPEPPGPRKFYRVIGYSTTAEDSDGDGLSDAFETSTDRPASDRTDPNRVDSDFDGFSDSVEFAAGTDPNNALDFPSRANLPTVQFAEAISSAIEGQSPVPAISLVVDGPLSGTVAVAYSVNARSTATAPDDFAALSGTVNVSASGGAITLNLVDDLDISPERVIILDLAPNGGANYRTGGRTTHVVCISENDCCWSGVLKDRFASRNFRMRLLRDASTTQAAFIAGSVDGLLQPDNNASSQSEGVIPTTPKEIWNATGTDGPDLFMITSESMPASTGSAFGSVQTLSRVLVLTAEPGPTKPSHVIHPDRYVGDYTENLTSSAGAHLNRTASGTFVLVKDLPAPAPGLLP